MSFVPPNDSLSGFLSPLDGLEELPELLLGNVSSSQASQESFSSESDFIGAVGVSAEAFAYLDLNFEENINNSTPVENNIGGCDDFLFDFTHDPLDPPPNSNTELYPGMDSLIDELIPLQSKLGGLDNNIFTGGNGMLLEQDYINSFSFPPLPSPPRSCSPEFQSSGLSFDIDMYQDFSDPLGLPNSLLSGAQSLDYDGSMPLLDFSPSGSQDLTLNSSWNFYPSNDASGGGLSANLNLDGAGVLDELFPCLDSVDPFPMPSQPTPSEAPNPLSPKSASSESESTEPFVMPPANEFRKLSVRKQRLLRRLHRARLLKPTRKSKRISETAMTKPEVAPKPTPKVKKENVDSPKGDEGLETRKRKEKRTHVEKSWLKLTTSTKFDPSQAPYFEATRNVTIKEIINSIDKNDIYGRDMFYDLPPSRRKGIRLRYAGTDRPLTLNTPQRFHEEEDAFIRRELRRKLKEKKEKERREAENRDISEN